METVRLTKKQEAELQVAELKMIVILIVNYQDGQMSTSEGHLSLRGLETKLG